MGGADGEGSTGGIAGAGGQDGDGDAGGEGGALGGASMTSSSTYVIRMKSSVTSGSDGEVAMQSP